MPTDVAPRGDGLGAEDAMLVSASILLLAAAATASAPPAGAPVVERFALTIGGEPLGTEEFRRVQGADGVTLTGKVSLTLPVGANVLLAQDTKLTRDGRLLSYSLDVDAPGQQAILRASPSDTGYDVTITAKGADEPLKTADLSGKTPVFLLDNSFASHLDALTRTLAGLGVGEERALTALVPQVLQAIPGTIKRGADGRASASGVPVATRSYRLTVANVATELTARADDGALLQAEVPIQRAILRRQGFEPAVDAGTSPREGSAVDPRERAVAVVGPAGSLPGTLLLPRSETPSPAVVFLSGSGPNDRDETIGPNKPFADLARGLGDRGIASLRFDKRTRAIKDEAKLADVQLKGEYYDDAAAALALLGATPGIDPKRIFVLGHSEGAMVAPIVASLYPETRGVVMMAPAARPLDTLIIEQMEYGGKLTGRSADEIAQQTQDFKATFAAIRDPQRKDTPPFMGAPASYWREVLALDVPKLVTESKLPILVLQGDRDIQVSTTRDFDLLRNQVGDCGGRVTYRSFAGLNHLFMKVERESTGAEYGILGHVDPAVISSIADWILLR